MMSLPVLREDDIVLVRGTVFMVGRNADCPVIRLGADLTAYADSLEIVSVETLKLRVGDRVIADGHPGVVFCIWPDGDLAWVRPDGGNKRPWTVETAKIRREPQPSDEVERRRERLRAEDAAE